MATFAQIKANIKSNLGDSAFYSDTEVDESVQDAYNTIVALSQCIVKKTTLSFQDNLNYYNFRDNTNFSALYVADFMAPTAIFSNATNLWLLDDKTLKDFDKDRIDWENWTGQPVWWAPTNDYKRIALVPKLTTAVGTFDLYYWAQAPTVDNSDTPLLPPDFECLIESYSCADLLESAEEFVKAKNYWNEFWGVENGEQDFNAGIFALALRTKNIAKSDLLMLG